MPQRAKRSAREMWEQLELLGPRPKLPQWSRLPPSVQREVTTLLARVLRAAWPNASARGRDGEVDHE